MTDPVDMIVPLLREVRAESAALHQQTREQLAAVNQRLDQIEAAQLAFWQALTTGLPPSRESQK